MASSPKFWDKIAQKYADKPIDDQESYEHKLELTRAHLRPDMKLLEIGCGTGSTAILHAPQVESVLATDISSKMLDIARQRAEEAGSDNLRFECAAVEDLELSDTSFDMVLALSLVHLVADRRALFAEVHRMLAPGGLFVSSTPCLKDGLGFIKYIEPIGRLFGFMPMVKVFKASTLRQEIQAAGFEIIEDWCPGPRKALFLIAKKVDG